MKNTANWSTSRWYISFSCCLSLTRHIQQCTYGTIHRASIISNISAKTNTIALYTVKAWVKKKKKKGFLVVYRIQPEVFYKMRSGSWPHSPVGRHWVLRDRHDMRFRKSSSLFCLRSRRFAKVWGDLQRRKTVTLHHLDHTQRVQKMWRGEGKEKHAKRLLFCDARL